MKNNLIKKVTHGLAGCIWGGGLVWCAESACRHLKAKPCKVKIFLTHPLPIDRGVGGHQKQCEVWDIKAKSQECLDPTVQKYCPLLASGWRCL